MISRKTRIGSNRIYVDEMDIDNLGIENTILKFNKYEYSAYNLYFLYKEDKDKYELLYKDKSCHMVLKEKYGLDDYYTNSILQNAKGIYNSQVECLKGYKNTLKERINSINKKIDKENKTLDKYLSLRKDINLYKKDKEYKIKYKGYTFKDNKFKCNLTNKEYSLNEFEYNYLNKNIKKCKNKISRLKYKLTNTNNKLNNLKIKKPVFYKKYLNDKIDFIEHKYNKFNISGRKDAGVGNFVFKLNVTPDTLKNSINFKDIKFNLNIKLIDKTFIEFKNIFFYNGKDILNILNNNLSIPLGFELQRRYDNKNRLYYQIFIVYELNYFNRLNNYTKDGIIGLDFNVGHIDLTETDKNGNILYTKVIKYNTNGNSNERYKSLHKAIKECIDYASDHYKPVSIEKLDTSKSKKKMLYKDKALNKTLSDFSYSKYTDICLYLCIINNIELIQVNPFLTSFMGIKYSDKCLNKHILASYIIARRGQGFKEKIPSEFLNLIDKKYINNHHWKQWFEYKKYLDKKIKY